MSKLKHVYPRSEVWSRAVYGKPQEKVGSETAADVIPGIRWETLTEEPPGNVLVLCPYPEVKQRFDEVLRKGAFDPSRVSYLVATTIEKEVNVPAIAAHQLIVENAETGEKQVTEIAFQPVRKKKIKLERRLHLGSRRNMLAIKKHVDEADASLLVIIDPNEEEGDLNYLAELRKLCPELDLIVYHRYSDKYGVISEGDIDPENWEDEFPVMGDCELPKPEVIVDDLLVKAGIHVWAGMFESYKTVTGIELSAAILEKRKAFDWFDVKSQYPVLFLCPDMSPEQFQEYARPFGLMQQKDFRVLRPNGNTLHSLDSPVMQQAVKGRILFLDTMLDYATIKEAFQSKEWVEFFAKLRMLINVCGCVAIVMLVHPTKTGARSNTIDPSEYLKDSVTFGGKIDIGFAFSKLENTSQIFIQRIKGRGFKKPLSFTITHTDDDGNSHLDRGRFPVYLKPGEAGKKEDHTSKAGVPSDPLKQQKIDFARTVDGSFKQKADAVNKEFGSKHTKSTIHDWLKPFDAPKGADTND